jgi:hypothetical protein
MSGETSLVNIETRDSIKLYSFSLSLDGRGLG